MEFLITLIELLFYVFIATAAAILTYLLTISIVLKKRIQSEKLNEDK